MCIIFAIFHFTAKYNLKLNSLNISFFNEVELAQLNTQMIVVGYALISMNNSLSKHYFHNSERPETKMARIALVAFQHCDSTFCKIRKKNYGLEIRSRITFKSKVLLFTLISC